MAKRSLGKVFNEDLRRHDVLSFTIILPTRKLNEKVFENLTLDLPSTSTVRSLRLNIILEAKNKSAQRQVYEVTNPESYQLLYKKGVDWYEIYDDQQILQTLEAVRYWKMMGVQRGEIHIKNRLQAFEVNVEHEKMLVELIGCDLGELHVSQSYHDELAFARRQLARPRQLELRQRDRISYIMEPWATSMPLPENLKAFATHNRLVTIFHGKESLKVDINVTDLPDAVIHRYFVQAGLGQSETKNDLVLKVCNREEYIVGSKPLIDFLWIRHCLKSKQEINLSLVPAPYKDEDDFTSNDWPLIDELTGFRGTHEDLQLKDKDVEQIIVLSLWDCDRKFRAKIVGIDIPNLPTKPPQQVYIVANILHGNRILSSATTNPKAFTDEVLWNIWLEFDILVKNLPECAKLNLSVYEEKSAETLLMGNKCPQQSGMDWQMKANSKLLFFVNLLLIDHRSLLQQGEHVLYMWPYPEQDDELFTFEADRISSKTNPSIEDTVAIHIFLDTYIYPVVLPYARTLELSCLSPTGTISSPTNTEVFTFQDPDSLKNMDRLKGFKEQCANYGRNLPKYLCQIQWGDMETVQDLHWLLDHWDPQSLDIAIALELLSINFADKNVRSMSVKRLEALSTEELLRYLLQLVQALKFETYHDSALARFLIRRSLKSKRLGHFFFWYLRSEISGSPCYRDRFAVILEAYLRGCRRSILEGFQKQVQLVEKLHRVATDIKKVLPERGDIPADASTQLQEMLQAADLPKNFQVPFDPRIQAGEILVSKCKVMASKKKPLWLEFSCRESDVVDGPPIGVIFKHGDDLRQDMMIVQMLVIMDSIWQEHSLDLNLVPYGCISTGYKIGMIEIVRDSRTIASVQRSKGATGTQVFKDDALHSWLRTECKIEEKYYEAMERFVTSCAGYSIATYILGIGDRHNDNIMITNQGNLFHIDFGHILGNTKRFMGVNREWVPFVLTPDFLYVMGRTKGKSSLYFQRFKDICTQAYIALRSHSQLLVTLFSLMMLTGLPELSNDADLHYLKEALALGRGEDFAKKHLLYQISICENLNWTVQANWWIHLKIGNKQS
ncbi:phosphatidylinositol 4,5-bisphosphate 3-kinase catalytic subunit gamma isoform-like [Ambystoma mexicanum]|uniref:phosphatidylinositol 4,5-bisphosphate 3-kinase catalytic subunit gamma isoform-like n=1 Tax=Ambystoma mexicanum TaxID=8296 RepID=UPI0037E86CAB